MRYATLPLGDKMPMLGLGTWTLKGQEAYDAVQAAIEAGYTHIDTAEAYGNHKQIGSALQDLKVDRGELFVTSKVWRENLRYDDCLAACDESLRDLQMDYLDLFLIHWPNESIPMEETFRALTELQEQGKIRNVGVSNFTIDHLQEAKEITDTAIATDQVEYHPWMNQNGLLNYCKRHDIAITAYSPLARGKVLNDDHLQELAERAEMSVAQMALTWLLEKGMVVIPRSSSEEHLRQNLRIFDLSLPDKVVEELEAVDKEQREVEPPSSAS
jgi:diketogulonate reductase-like aldo/keto reductase